MKMDIDPPCQIAAEFWLSIRERNIEQVFELISSKCKGYAIGLLQSEGLISFTDEPVSTQLKSLKERFDDAWWEKQQACIPLDYTPTNRAKYDPDHLHAVVRLIPEDKYKNVAFIKPTQIPDEEVAKLHMVLELVTAHSDGAKRINYVLQWRVDWYNLDAC